MIILFAKGEKSQDEDEDEFKEELAVEFQLECFIWITCVPLARNAQRRCLLGRIGNPQFTRHS